MSKYKKYLYPCILSMILLLMMLYPADTLAGSRRGLLLWFRTVLPTLLPYLIITNLLMNSHLIYRIFLVPAPFFRKIFSLSACGSFALLSGLLCGYPMGAKITADLYRNGHIDSLEADYLLATVNNPSPAFLITYVLQENLHGRLPVLIALPIFYLGVYLTMVCWRLIHPMQLPVYPAIPKKETSRSSSKGELIDASIMNSFETITKMGGYIILCSIFIALLKKIPLLPPSFRWLQSCVLEIATGIQRLSQSDLLWKLQCPMMLSLSAFGGLCILLQTNSVIRCSGLTLRPYIKGKLLQSIITAVLFLVIVA